MEGKLPNLLIIGAMKSGTSSLHDYLSLHPDIFMSGPKEIHYFADENYHLKTIDWYKSFFKTDKKIRGCSPQSYTKCHNKFYQHIPERIKKHKPDVKMIYIVRDPIKRYSSHILESYHCDPQEDILYSKESDNYLKTSMYYMQLQAYLKYFDLSQIHILSLEDLEKNRLDELNAIFRFLGVEELRDEKLFDFVTNAAETKAIPTVIRHHWLYRLGNKISRKITTKIANRIASNFFAHQLKKQVLTEKEEKELRTKLEEDVTNFRKITGKDFSNWSI